MREFLKHARQIREAYQRGENVTRFMNGLLRTERNTSPVIEFAYDLQAGSYLQGALRDPQRWESYTGEIASHMARADSYLEVGVGEATTLIGVMNRLAPRGPVLGLDLSWSRIAWAREHAMKQLGYRHGEQTRLFCGDLFSIPLQDNAVDVVYTAHSLEPNGGREAEAIGELLRVARKALFLFEPSFEDAPAEGQQRMAHHGYVRDLPGAIEQAGGFLQGKYPIASTANPLNPTYCFHVTRTPDGNPADVNTPSPDGIAWACPWTGAGLIEHTHHFYSPDSGFAYPLLRNIPLLKRDNAVIATWIGAFSP